MTRRRPPMAHEQDSVTEAVIVLGLCVFVFLVMYLMGIHVAGLSGVTPDPLLGPWTGPR